MMVLNMFVAVVLEGFSESMKDSGKAVNSDVLTELRKKWSEFDPNAKGWLSIDDVAQILHEIPPPFGFRNLERYPDGFEKDEYKRMLSNV